MPNFTSIELQLSERRMVASAGRDVETGRQGKAFAMPRVWPPLKGQQLQSQVERPTESENTDQTENILKSIHNRTRGSNANHLKNTMWQD